MNPLKILKNGIIKENPIFVQAIGMCPTLAVTTSAENGLAMGLATTAVLAFSNSIISIVRNFVPDKARIPSYVVIIASLVTVIQFMLEAYLPSLNESLGLFIPLIVVNCLILARAESFASKNGPIASFIDGLGMGLGFALALTIIGIIREILGVGSFFGISIPLDFPKMVIMILPPGAFITLAFIMAFLNHLKNKKQRGESR